MRKQRKGKEKNKINYLNKIKNITFIILFKKKMKRSASYLDENVTEELASITSTTGRNFFPIMNDDDMPALENDYDDMPALINDDDMPDLINDDMPALINDDIPALINDDIPALINDDDDDMPALIPYNEFVSKSGRIALETIDEYCQDVIE